MIKAIGQTFIGRYVLSFFNSDPTTQCMLRFEEAAV
jgi:hypothetical protein